MSTTSLAYSSDLLNFIAASPTAFHATEQISKHLDSAGFVQLREHDSWKVAPGTSFYVTRNGSSIIAVRIAQDMSEPAFRIAAAHTDSPTFKIKANSELAGPGGYLRLDVEPYGGMIDESWFDKPLGVAGRVVVADEHGAHTRLVTVGDDVALIPSVAPHLDHEGSIRNPNRANDLMPLLSCGAMEQGDFAALVAQAAEAEPKDLLASDLYLVNRTPGRIWGAKKEFISAPRLDDLQSAYAALRAFMSCSAEKGIQVLACFDNEEVGSNTKQGAMSTFLADVLGRVCDSLGMDRVAYGRTIARSFMASCDNAHATHPAHPELHDASNSCLLNHGPVIKENAAQHYTTDAFSRAILERIFQRAGVPVQTYANRSDLRGGSTLGNLSNIQVSMHAADMGLPQLAMHSNYETAGVEDLGYAIAGLTAFYDADDLRIHDDIRFDLQA